MQLLGWSACNEAGDVPFATAEQARQFGKTKVALGRELRKASGNGRGGQGGQRDAPPSISGGIDPVTVRRANHRRQLEQINAPRPLTH